MRKKFPVPAVARALIAKPDIILTDEPTGNPDSKSGGEVIKCSVKFGIAESIETVE